MTRNFWAILYYALAIPTIIISQRFFDHSVGIGLNIYVFFVVTIYAFYMLFRDLRLAIVKFNVSYQPVYIHLAGLFIILYLIFFDQFIMLKG